MLHLAFNFCIYDLIYTVRSAVSLISLACKHGKNNPCVMWFALACCEMNDLCVPVFPAAEQVSLNINKWPHSDYSWPINKSCIFYVKWTIWVFALISTFFRSVIGWTELWMLYVHGRCRVLCNILVKSFASSYMGAFFQLTTGLISVLGFPWFHGGI
jgi:hypothetical protein